MAEKNLSRRKFLITSSLGIGGAMLAGCELEELETPKIPSMARRGDYLSKTDNLYFNQGIWGIGNHKFYFPLGMDDAKWLIDNPIFKTCLGAEGGLGRTLQIVGYDVGVFLLWAQNHLETITVFPPWQGKITETDIKLGDSIDDFITKYPNAKKSERPPSFEYYRVEMPIKNSTSYKLLIAEYDNNRKIDQLGIVDGDESFWYIPPFIGEKHPWC